MTISIEKRREILEQEIAKYVKEGWHVVSRTDKTSQLTRERGASCLVAFILAIFLIVPAVLYLLLYKKTEGLYIEVDRDGNVHITHT